MSDVGIGNLDALVPPLLRTLETLALIARHLNPPELADLLTTLGSPDEELRSAMSAAAPWPATYAALGTQLDKASEEALNAFAGLREFASDPGGLSQIFRALRHVPRALEALYPLAGLAPPVNRFFLDAEHRTDKDFQSRFLKPPAAGTGLIQFGDDPAARETVWAYVPETYSTDVAHPLVVCLHGGAGRGRGFIWSWVRDARSRGVIVAAPTSMGQTWAIQGEDIDTPRLASIVAFMRANWSIDTERVLLTGMSDGGTFCYVSGLEAGSPFTHLAPIAAAFHPMLAQIADERRLAGLPIHILHGALDWMFPVSMAREAERYFRAAGAAVTYREAVDLSHTYPTEMNAAILDWFADPLAQAPKPH